MIDISLNNTITLNHGDNFYAELFLDEGTDYYCTKHILQEGEYVYFAIEEPNQPFEKALVRKVFDKSNLTENNTVKITLSSEDTINILPGTYYYEIKTLTYNAGEPVISTAVDKTKFIIL